VRSDGQLERHKNCIGLSPFSPPVIVTFASELDKTALSFLAVVHSVADDYVYRVPVAVLKDKRAPTSKQLLHALSVMLERQYGPCVGGRPAQQQRVWRVDERVRGRAGARFLAPLVGVSLG
jgi:hypothetical protein